MMPEESFKVGEWVEYQEGNYRIAAVDAFGFCLLKDRNGEIALIHAPSREFTQTLVTDVEKAFFDNSK